MHDPDPPPLGASYGGFATAEAPCAKAEGGTRFSDKIMHKDVQ
jgi:hypothetical protein